MQNKVPSHILQCGLVALALWQLPPDFLLKRTLAAACLGHAVLVHVLEGSRLFAAVSPLWPLLRGGVLRWPAHGTACAAHKYRESELPAASPMLASSLCMPREPRYGFTVHHVHKMKPLIF